MRSTTIVSIAFIAILSMSFLVEGEDGQETEPEREAPILEELIEEYFHIHFNWTLPQGSDLSDLSGFRIYSGDDPGNLTTVDLLIPSERSFDIAELINGNSYSFVIAALYGEELEEKRSEVFTGIPGGPPKPPIDLELIQDENGIRLNWTFDQFNDGFQEDISIVQRSCSNDEFEFLTTVAKGINTYLDATFKSGYSLSYRVIATNERGPSIPSNIVRIFIESKYQPPLEPLDLSIGDIAPYIELTWEPPSSNGGMRITDYIVLRSTEEGPYEEIHVTPFAIEIAFDNNVTSGLLYSYIVIARNGVGESQPSEPVNILYFYEEPDEVDPGNETAPDSEGFRFATRNSLIVGGAIGGFLILIAIIIYLKITRDVDDEDMEDDIPIDETGRDIL